MSPEAKRKRARERVRAHRQKLRAQGLRPVTFWIRDTRTPEFEAEARRQSLAVANSPDADDDQAFIDAVSELKFE
jgi:hypothetical protein